MLLTPRSAAISLALLWSAAHWLEAQTVPAPTPVTGNFKTVYGKEYKDATVSRIEPDGLVLKTKSGISKVYFTELPKEVQERFLPSPAKTVAAQRERKLIELKSWVAAMANPTSFVLLFVGGASLIAAVAFAIVRSRLQ